MKSEEIFSNLEDIFQAIFRDPKLRLKPEMAAPDIAGWNSVRMINIILSVEERFGVRLIGRDIDSLETVGDLAALIARHRSG